MYFSTRFMEMNISYVSLTDLSLKSSCISTNASALVLVTCVSAVMSLYIRELMLLHKTSDPRVETTNRLPYV